MFVSKKRFLNIELYFYIDYSVFLLFLIFVINFGKFKNSNIKILE